ncbi:ATP-binding protein [Saccharopolyspora phatthalungensis]|uniref:Non-specific serine/threonine protein kinase n=1 Tax=Saccharopolyspora phatthalungensis TaxID=664693 RepID=A0A840Q0X6_9PSEU|nr:LuxR C-terminal-related transcriptional regulator [Saccharopolyspora phatthalungensis]MBB5153647.1 non-specific serine/threonine protein kinase [Saccharopolyspora phatthalungensis]
MHAFSEELSRAGYQIFVGSTDDDVAREEQIVRSFLGRRPDWFLLVGAQHTARTRALPGSAGVPVVETWDWTDEPIDLRAGFSNALATADAVPVRARALERMTDLSSAWPRSASLDTVMHAPSLRRSEGRWPADVTSFVGRRRELIEVRRALSSSRLVTLTGVGGVGKTRLASRAGRELRRVFSDGVWLVELTGLEDEGLVPQAIVTALGFHDPSTRWTAETVAERVGDQQLLLILDNCEHVLDTCAVTAATLLKNCPQIRILATSRQALGIAGEHLFSVPTLRWPEPHAATEGHGLTAYEALALFVDRAKTVVPDFALDERTGPLVADLCRRLDGIPLAIELAAYSLRVLSLDQILQRLDDRFGLLTSGSRAALPRHQTLRAVIDWSFELCSEKERKLWARASVFAGDFDLEDAEVVCSGDCLDRYDVLTAVSGLVDKSILIREEREGRVRYRLLETIRQYGREVLGDSGEEYEVRRRHRDWCLQLVEQMEHCWFGPDQAAWFSRIRGEHANIRTALEFCLHEVDEVVVGMRMADVLRDYWRVGGLISEGRRWCERLLERDGERGTSRLDLVISAIHLALLQNDLPVANALLEAGHRLARDLGDETATMRMRAPEAFAAALQADFRQAVAKGEQVMPELRESGDLRSLSTALTILALNCSLLADPERATRYSEELLELCRSHGEKWRQSYALWALALEAWRQGDMGRSSELARESLSLQREFRDYHCTVLSVEVLAWVAATEHNSAQAARLFGLAHRIRREAGGKLFTFFNGYQEQCEKQARHSLGESEYAKLFAQGAEVSLDRVLAYALGEPGGAAERPKEEFPTQLSRRERETAELVAQGMSNKQIAEHLVISQRTAEAHVEHILVKLGFTSRSQIAAWVAERWTEPGPR